MRLIDEVATPVLDGSALDMGLSDSELALRDQARQFAARVLRPTGDAMDKMTGEEAGGPNSPWYEAFTQFQGLGLDFELMYFNDDLSTANRLKSIVFEELGWGDAGLTITFGLAGFPAIFARKLNRMDLAEEFATKLGCWNGTQRNRGSDLADSQGMELDAGRRHLAPDLTATRVEGGYVLNGKSSPWVSMAPLAQAAFSHFPLADKEGKPLYREDGTIPSITAIHPLDVEGVTIGPAVETIGMRTDPMGYIVFDDVFLPDHYVVADEIETPKIMMSSAAEVSLTMSSVFTGVARAAYEHVQAYSHERVQGGRPIVEHQMVKARLFRDFQKVEASRAVSRHAWQSIAVSKEAHPLAAFVAKTYCTETALDVSSSAQQGMGSNGLTPAFPVEKLVRDSKAGLIADGENNLQSIVGGSYLMNAFREAEHAGDATYEDTYPLYD